MLGDIWVYKKTSRIYVTLLLLAVIMLATQNWQLGVLLFIIVAGCIVYTKRCDLTQEKKLMKYLDDLSAGVSAGTVYAVKNLPIGIAMMDSGKELVWTNGVFRSWLGDDAQEGASLQDLITGQKISKIWGKTGWFDCHANGTFFRVFHKYVSDTEGMEDPFMVLYFMDRTDVEVAVRECADARPVFCIIRIDNMSEVTSEMTDVERSSLLSDVTEKVLSYFNERDGFIKQYNDTDFVACISHKALVEMMEHNFDILDTVRAIHTVNRIPVTLSIGVAQIDDTFAKQYDEAQVSLDLALGRGGDQAIVRIGKDTKAFGGKAPTSVSSTRVRVRVVAQALKEIIEGADLVLVMGHNHEDFDALGSAVGVTHLARSSHIETHIVLSKERDTCRKMAEAIEKSGEVEGLIIDAGEAKSLVTDKTVLVVVDTHIPELVAAPELLKKVKKRVVIDHHRRAKSIIETPLLTYMEPSASSASELVTELIQYYGGDEEMNEIEASCLYAGIVVDTKSFTVQTSVRTFDAASYLRRCGANTQLVHRLFAEDIGFIQKKAQILAQMKIAHGCIAVAECPKDAEESQILAGQIADYLVTVKEIRASFVFYHSEKGLCISARSDGSINMQVIMEAVGGGGHQTVAGAQVGDEADQEAITKTLIQEAEKQIEEEKE
ncbi:DHH family phosphoesterase [Dialister hominis]|uniref:DHH family phosphoesterase n=1 Tax=Dialister hominis TaxID=2582419 RepID=UPI003FEF363A